MIYIPIEKHKEYMSIDFTQDSEFPDLIKIREWLDKNLINMDTDEKIWYSLVKAFLSLKDGKKTKSFIYQVMVCNGIVEDPNIGKRYCSKRMRNCVLIEHNALKNGIYEITERTYDGLCPDMSICFYLPSGDYSNVEYSDNIKSFELDDTIIKTREKK